MQVQITQDDNVLYVRVFTDEAPDAPLSWKFEPLVHIKNATLEALRAATVAAPAGGGPAVSLRQFTALHLEFGTAGLAKAAIPTVERIVTDHLPA